MIGSCRVRAVALGALVVIGTACGPPARSEADSLRATERERLRALVAADVARARQLHADDFQLINPRGGVLSKEQYLEGIASGQIDYLFWEPDSIAVRLYRDAAVIRYPSQLEIVVQGTHVPRQRYWHTDLYERREGRWQWCGRTRPEFSDLREPLGSAGESRPKRGRPHGPCPTHTNCGDHCFRGGEDRSTACHSSSITIGRRHCAARGT
jgi:hypothetical protein